MSFAGITDLWAYLIGCIAIVLLPGPNSLFVMSTAALADRRGGWAAIAGVLVADTVFIVGSALGLVALLSALPWLFAALRWAGAAYLVWIGLALLVAAWRALRACEPGAVGAGPKIHAAAMAIPAGGAARTFRKALAIGLLNPKAVMFYVAFFPQFVDPAGGDWFTFAVMGTILQACSFAYLAALVATGASLAAAVRRSRWLGALGKTAIGALFIGFGARLAAAQPVQ
ncbi:MAG: leucine efflux protein LeuE [Burkholderiaceae bacterium]|nr:leucine efflux protein LeuE [Burkholderiaceae bacterium]